MTALAADRPIREDLGREYTIDVYQATTIYAGALVCANSTGYLVPGSVSTSLLALGVAMEQVDNSAGASGDLACRYRRGAFLFGNSAGADEITNAERGQFVYIVDDQTVAKTNGSSTRSVAGKCLGIDAATSQVIVEVGYYQSADGDLVASNNLSDVGAAATARANIGANLVVLTVPAIALDAAEVIYVVSPVAGDVTKIWTGLRGALTGGDPTITAGIEGTPITGGMVTIANAGSAAGDKDSATPSAANTVAAGEYIDLTVAANSQSNTEYCDLTILIET